MERKKKQIVRPRRHGEEIDGEKLERQHRGLMGGSFSRFNRSSSLEGERVRDSLDLEEDMQEMKVDQKLLVAALDIGTTYSGYAFSFAHEQSGDTADPDRIHVNTWENEGGSRTYFKTPSCLLLHPNKTLHSFGHEAIEKYNSLTEDKQHHDWYFFWQFKMTLHQEEEIRGDAKLKEENQKELDSLTVFSLSIKYLKQHLIDVVRNSTPDVRDTDIRWVITVPAIWKDSAKKFMRQAAEQAGMPKDQIEIALEPEAASLYCRSMKAIRTEQGGAAAGSGLTKFPKGTRYMVLDCGGGTVDVTVHEVIRHDTLRELHAATGGDWGGTKVNKAFWNFISQLAGPEKFHAFSVDHKGDYLHLLNDFEVKKRMTKPDSSDVVTIRIPATLYQILRENEHNFLKVEGAVSLIGDKLRIQSKQFSEFFDAAIKDILKHVEELVEIVPGPLAVILLVGGFAESPILQKAIKDQFGRRFSIIIPIDASLCVMKGAVLYGFNPTSIACRRSRYTYGVSTSMAYREGAYPADRNHGGFVDDIFDKHVEIDQDIPTNKALSERTYFPITNDDKLLHISLYRSSKRDPKFVDEQGCQRVGTVEVKIDRSIGRGSRDRPIKVKTIFGSSDIKILAQQANGKTKEADFKLNGM